MNKNKITNYLTIDVEDYFQVSAFEKIVKTHQNWSNYPSRVENNTRKILDILAAHNTKATFFIVGWVAEKFPQLVKEIAQQGHPLGCHSYYHRLVYNLSPDEFRQDTKKAKEILEQISGQQVNGYRAPSYSITKRSLWALNILDELGFTYDSSIFPIYHDRYGIPDAPRFKFQWDLKGKHPQYPQSNPHKTNQHTNKPTNQLTEYPISTALFFGKKLPVSGGGYFRLFPYRFTKMALNKINTQDKQPFIFYLHPWEVDPEQPKMNNAGKVSRFRHYVNLNKTAARLERLLEDFKFGPISNEHRELT